MKIIMKKKFVIVNQVAGTQIDEERLRNYVDKTLEAEFQDKLLTGEVKIDLNQQAYKQPSVKASKELKKELKSSKVVYNYMHVIVAS